MMTDALKTPLLDEDKLVLTIEKTVAPDITESSERMLRVCLRVWKMLDDKNAAYGDSALKPMRVFSSADTNEQIRVRIDDKLSRLARGHAAGEDAALDLLGYLVLLKVAELDWSLDFQHSAPQPTIDAERKPFVRRNAVPADWSWRCGRCNMLNAGSASRCIGMDCLAR